MIVVIAGPIASGKSTLAGEVVRQLAESGRAAAAIDLDEVHAELAAGGANADGDAGESAWTSARRLAGARAKRLLDEGLAVVIAEGSFNSSTDREAFTSGLERAVEPAFVTLVVSFAEALRRARRDPTRGRSRDPAFLRAQFVTWQSRRKTVPASDLLIDTERTPLRVAAARIVAMAVRRSGSPGATSPGSGGPPVQNAGTHDHGSSAP